ncbi:MAG: hypothetical protein ACOYIS_05795 [Candidatus Cloacimonadaceae bacterium]|jgi:methyl-accepting chemotaxis protein
MLSIVQLFLPVTESFKLDVSQLIFYLMMLGLSFWSIYSLRKYANETSWEKKWTNHTSTIDDDIGVEHGSVVELCQVVATKPEQFAGILPGIMVTLGLLGTFVGLAQSLGQAAMTISSSMSQLAVPSSNYSGMERALTGMIGMLQGMGTQFKTSIWGIIWFLVLRSIYGKMGFESKRLQWTITKMRIENQINQDSENKYLTGLFDRVIHVLDQSNKTLGELLNTQYAGLSEMIGKSIQSVVSMLENQNQKSINENKNSIGELQKALISHSDKQLSSLQGSLDVNNKALSQIIRENTTAITNSSEEVKTELGNQAATLVNVINTQSNTAIDTNKNSLNDLQKALINNTDTQYGKLQADLSSNREQIEKAMLSNTNTVVNGLNDNKSTLETRSQDIVDKIKSQSDKLDSFSQACLANFTDLNKHAQDTANNTEQFKTTIENFTTDIQGSIDKISDAAGMVENSAIKLADVVTNLDAKIGHTLEEMSVAISNTISTMNASFNENIEKTEAALTKSADGIAAQVENMSQALGSKIATFDQTMKSATQQLSATINDMQDKIKEVLDSIKTELSTTVKEMNDSFSENLRKNAESFNESVNNITAAVDSMSVTMDTKLEEFSQMTSSSTEQLKQTITEMRNNINTILGSLNNDVGATINKMNSMIDKSTKSLELSVKGISAAAATMEEQIKKSFVEFNKSMETLVNKQKDALVKFDASMNEVAENINVVTGEFKKMNDQLNRSLEAVSSGNLELKDSLESMKVIHKDYKELISSLDTLVDKLNKNLTVMTPKNTTPDGRK